MDIALIHHLPHNNMPEEKKPKKDKKLFELGPMEQVLVILGIMAFGTLMMADSCMSNEQVPIRPCPGQWPEVPSHPYRCSPPQH